MLGWPMVEPPKDWEFKADVGRENFTGGYHLPSSRTFYPLVRSDGGVPSKTIPSRWRST